MNSNHVSLVETMNIDNYTLKMRNKSKILFMIKNDYFNQDIQWSDNLF